MPPSFVLVWFVCIAACTHAPGAGEPDSGLREGFCGMTGRLVECNSSLDCVESGTGADRCSIYGTCYEDDGHDGCTGIGFRGDCGERLVCDDYRMCSRACFRHMDCPVDQYCACFSGYLFVREIVSAGFCGSRRCNPESQACPVHFEPIDGSFACFPVFLEGDCHRFVPEVECPPGYESDGDLGCRLVEPYTWIDAGVP